MKDQLQHPAGNRWPPPHHFQIGHLRQFEQFSKESCTLPSLPGLKFEMTTGLLADLQAGTKPRCFTQRSEHWHMHAAR